MFFAIIREWQHSLYYMDITMLEIRRVIVTVKNHYNVATDVFILYFAALKHLTIFRRISWFQGKLAFKTELGIRPHSLNYTCLQRVNFTVYNSYLNKPVFKTIRELYILVHSHEEGTCLKTWEILGQFWVMRLSLQTTMVHMKWSPLGDDVKPVFLWG